MCTYRESPDFQLFQNWNRFNYSQYIRELKDDRKMDDLARLSFRKETLSSTSLNRQSLADTEEFLFDFAQGSLSEINTNTSSDSMIS